MAFVPDDAIKRKRRAKLSPAAWDVYEAHCMARDHEARVSRASKERISKDIGIAVKTVWNATTELTRKKWIAFDERGHVRLLVGDFSPADDAADERARKRGAQHSRIRESGRGGVPGSGNEIPQSGNDFPETGKEIPGSGNGAYRGSRARSSSPSVQHSDQHLDQPRTHDTDAHGAREGDGAGVRVSSKFSKEELWRYARNNRLGKGWVTQARRTGEWDDDVAEFLREHAGGNGAAAPAARRCDHTCPLCFGTGYANPDGKGARRCPNMAAPVEARAHAPPAAA